MEILFSNSLNDVIEFYPLNSKDCIIVSPVLDKNELLNNNYYQIKKNNEVLNADIIRFRDNNLIQYCFKNNNTIFSLSTGQLIGKKTEKPISYFWNDSIALSMFENIGNTKTVYQLINLFTNEILFEFEKGINTKIIEDDKCYFEQGQIDYTKIDFSTFHKIISCFSFTKIDYLWHYNIGSLYESHTNQMAEYEGLNPEINQIIGVHNGILWLDIIVRAANSFILGLDAANGTVVHFLQDILLQNEVEYHQLWPQFGLRLPSNNGNTFIDTERNRLYGFRADDYYWQVDLNDASPTIKVTSLKHLTQQYDCFFCDLTNCGISKQHIYFPVGGIGAKSNGVVVFNKDTMAIDYILPLDPKQGFGAPNQIKINETHLFVKSKEGILSVFEKTED